MYLHQKQFLRIYSLDVGMVEVDFMTIKTQNYYNLWMLRQNGE